MALSATQVKGRIKNVARENNADARVLLRIYAMERFLERVANSKYQDRFVIKDGILVTALVGVAQRSTMDIDTSLQNENLSAEDAERIVREIAEVALDDGMTFTVKSVEEIMDEMEYPGIRVLMNAVLEKMTIPLKIDISTGDAITPRSVRFDYPLMLEKRTIPLWSYNLETILAEKLQTILARGILNTRMRDLYDVHLLMLKYDTDIQQDVLQEAFKATCEKRETNTLMEHADKIISEIESNESIRNLWEKYQKKYFYAEDISLEDVMASIRKLIDLAGKKYF